MKIGETEITPENIILYCGTALFLVLLVWYAHTLETPQEKYIESCMADQESPYHECYERWKEKFYD